MGRGKSDGHGDLFVKGQGVVPVSYTHLDVYKRQKYNRCKLCGRPHAYLRDYGVCRVCFRTLAYKGEIPGVRKASW